MPYIKVDPADAPVLPPEPWLFSPESGGILDANGNVAVLGEMLNLTGARIIACVNACQGVPTELLEAVQRGSALLGVFPKWTCEYKVVPDSKEAADE